MHDHSSSEVMLNRRRYIRQPPQNHRLMKICCIRRTLGGERSKVGHWPQRALQLQFFPQGLPPTIGIEVAQATATPQRMPQGMPQSYAPPQAASQETLLGITGTDLDTRLRFFQEARDRQRAAEGQQRTNVETSYRTANMPTFSRESLWRSE